MRRQLIAFLALLTGLAALGGPATASISEAINQDVGVSAEADTSSASTHAKPSTKPAKRARKSEGCEEARPIRLPATLRLPVLMGVERAYE